MPHMQNILSSKQPSLVADFRNFLLNFQEKLFPAHPTETLDMCHRILTSEQGLINVKKMYQKKSLIIDGAFGKTHPGHIENNL